MFCSHCLVSVNSINETSCCVFVEWSLNCLWMCWSDLCLMGLMQDWVWLSLTELQAVGHLTWITSDTAGHSELDQTFIFTSDHHNKKKKLLRKQPAPLWSVINWLETFYISVVWQFILSHFGLKLESRQKTPEWRPTLWRHLEPPSGRTADKDKSKHSQDLLEIKIKMHPVTESVLL